MSGARVVTFELTAAQQERLFATMAMNKGVKERQLRRASDRAAVALSSLLQGLDSAERRTIGATGMSSAGDAVQATAGGAAGDTESVLAARETALHELTRTVRTQRVAELARTVDPTVGDRVTELLGRLPSAAVPDRIRGLVEELRSESQRGELLLAALRVHVQAEREAEAARIAADSALDRIEAVAEELTDQELLDKVVRLRGGDGKDWAKEVFGTVAEAEAALVAFERAEAGNLVRNLLDDTWLGLGYELYDGGSDDVVAVGPGAVGWLLSVQDGAVVMQQAAVSGRPDAGRDEAERACLDAEQVEQLMDREGVHAARTSVDPVSVPIPMTVQLSQPAARRSWSIERGLAAARRARSRTAALQHRSIGGDGR